MFFCRFRIEIVFTGSPPLSSAAATLPSTWLSRGVTASGAVEPGQPEPQPERLPQAVQRGLGRVVPRVNRPEHVRARHPRLLCEFPDAHHPNHLPEGGLNRNALVRRREEEIPRELGSRRSCASPSFQSRVRRAMSRSDRFD